MSSWPLISHFASMLKNPQVGFRDPDLKHCVVEMNQLGQPKARSGNFATVYRGFRPDTTEFAIRVFNRRQDERLEHYRTISEYLESRAISSIVDFEYDEKGIRSSGDGKLYPLLTMEWVPGITLFEWTRDRCRENYAEALQIAADVWLHLVRELVENNVVHGDLQHGNVMVSPAGHFKLVDYDCMCVPSLVGRRNLETGLPPYQHPGRNADTLLFPGLDNFSALVIYVALRALAAAPQLWTTYVDQPEYDRILFRDDDFRTPALSPLYRDLMNSPDEQVRDLTHYLFELTRYDLQDVPPVDEVLLWCESIDSLVVSQEWDKVVQLVQRMGPGEQIAPQLQPVVQEAEQRVACRQAAEEALEQGDEERLEQMFNTGLLHNYPAAGDLLEPASRAAEVRPVLRVLASARQLQAWDKLKNIWLANQHLIQGRVSARQYEHDVQKLLTVDRIRELLSIQPVDHAAVLQAWDQLQSLGGHPTAEPYRAAVQQLASRHTRLEQLQQLVRNAPQSPTLSYDKQIAEAASPEVIQGMDPGSPMVKAYQQARRRLHFVKQVHKLEKQGTLDSEIYIAKVMQQVPQTYNKGLTRRCGQALKRVRAYRGMEKTLQGSPTEAELVECWERLGEVRGRVMAPPDIQKRMELAEARVPLLAALKEIPEDADPEEKQRRVMAIWLPEVLDDCAEAEPWREFFAMGQGSRTALLSLTQAIEAENLPEAERLLKLPEMQGIDVPDEVGARLHELRERFQQEVLASRQAIVNTLTDNQKTTFVNLFDAALVGEICQQFRHHQPIVRQWVETEILPAGRIGFQVDPEMAVTRDEEGNLHLHWTWPEPKISNECRLVICQKQPTASSLPEDVDPQHSVTIARHDWDEQLGYVVPLDPEWEGSRVFVWAVIEMGFQTFFSEPFEIGQIKAVAVKPKRWGLFRGWRSEKAVKSDEETAEDAADPEQDAGESKAGEATEPTSETESGPPSTGEEPQPPTDDPQPKK